jgi:tRNA A-37 threonylcarbamoyl transferase component Bud32
VVLIVPECTFVFLTSATDLNIAVQRYQRVKYDPLTISEAKCCLKEFVKEVSTALSQMHQCNLAHNDVRLPNICFSTEFKVVFIDVDGQQVGSTLYKCCWHKVHV